MSKEQEALRDKFISETKKELWAENFYDDNCFSDTYVHWLEEQVLGKREEKRDVPPLPNPDGGQIGDNDDWRGHEMGQ